MIAHPGGPFWQSKDAGAWSPVKGLIEGGETPKATAAREFAEETGWPAPPEPWMDLGEVTLKSGKRVVGWAVEADFDPAALEPGTFTMSIRGREQTFPEIDRVEWFSLIEARTRLNPAYREFLDRLERRQDENG